MSAITRALAALATITLLSVDDIEARKAPMIISRADQDQACQSGPANPSHRNPCMPRGIDPVAWAEYNASQARTLAELSGLPPAEPGVLELAPYQVRTESPLGELTTAVRRAASELEGTSEKGDRVAVQLLTALARFHAEIEAAP